MGRQLSFCGIIPMDNLTWGFNKNVHIFCEESNNKWRKLLHAFEMGGPWNVGLFEVASEPVCRCLRPVCHSWTRALSPDTVHPLWWDYILSSSAFLRCHYCCYLSCFFLLPLWKEYLKFGSILYFYHWNLQTLFVLRTEKPLIDLYF